MKKILSIFFTAALSAIFLAGCFTTKSEEKKETLPPQKTEKKAAAKPAKKSAAKNVKKTVAAKKTAAKKPAAKQNVFILYGTTDKNPVSYKVGEPMVFTIVLKENDKPVSGIKLKWTRAGDDGIKENGESVSDAAKPLVIRTSSKIPGFVRVTVKAYGKDGKEISNAKSRWKCLFDGGAGADVLALKGYPEPRKVNGKYVVDPKADPRAKSPDFDAFWKEQKARLAKVPVKVTLKKHPSPKNAPNVELYEFSIASVGAMPSTGWLCYPKNAKKGSLKAVVNMIGYGIGNISPNLSEGKKCLAMTISRHGNPMKQDKKFYEEQKKKIGGFCFRNNNDPEKTYYNEMILRDLRAVEYLKSRPEWNGKDLRTGGGSMGGYQSIAVAALDPAVTECTAFIPWCADLGGVKFKRMTGWRPGYTDVLGLYDIANFAKRIKCPVRYGINLGDYVCPPSGEFVMFNNISSDKTITYIINGGHGSGYQPNQKSYKMHFPAKK